MKTLVEIERAVGELPTAQKTELLLFVAQSLREEQSPLPEPPLFSDEQLRAWMRTRRRCAASARAREPVS